MCKPYKMLRCLVIHTRPNTNILHGEQLHGGPTQTTALPKLRGGHLQHFNAKYLATEFAMHTLCAKRFWAYASYAMMLWYITAKTTQLKNLSFRVH